MAKKSPFWSSGFDLDLLKGDLQPWLDASFGPVVGVSNDAIKTFLLGIGLDHSESNRIAGSLADLAPSNPVFAALYSALVVGRTLTSYTAPLVNAISQRRVWEVNKQVLPTQGEWGALRAWFWRSGDKTQYDLLRREMGFSDKWDAVLRESAKRRFSPEEAAELLRRGQFDEDQYKQSLIEGGIEDELVADRFRHLSDNKITPTEALELNRRGNISSARLDNILGTWGYSDTDADAIKSLTLPTIDVGTVASLLNRNAISSESARVALMRLGFDGQTADNLSDLAEQRIDSSSAIELVRRRKVTDGEGTNLLRRLGFSSSSITTILSLQERLPDLSENYARSRRGQISGSQVKRNLEQLGYRGKALDDLTALRHARPNLFEARQAWFRGVIDDNSFDELLTEQGFNEQDAETVKAISPLQATPSDLIRFLVREVFTPDIRERFELDAEYPEEATPEFKKLGIPEDLAHRYWQAHWDLPAIGQVFEMVHRKVIGPEDLDTYLKAADVMGFWRPHLKAIQFNLLPRRSLSQLIRNELVDVNFVQRVHEEHGWKPEDARKMTENAFINADFAARNRVATDVRGALIRGEIDEQEARRMLLDDGLGANRISFAITEALIDRELRPRQQERQANEEEEKSAREATKADIIRGLRAGIIDRETTDSMLQALTFTAETSDFIIETELLQQAIKDQEFIADQVKRLYEKHLLDDNQARVKLTAAGLAPPEANRTVELWNIERNTEDQLSTIRDRKPSRTNLADFLKSGIISSEDWLSGMENLGYTDDAISHFFDEVLVETGSVDQLELDLDPYFLEGE